MNKRPLRVTLLLWSVLFVIGYNVIRLWTAIAWSAILIEVNYQPGWLISALIAASWIILGCVAVYGIFANQSWSKAVVLGLAISYIAIYWIERLAWQVPRPNWSFALILHFVLLALIIYASSGVIEESHGG